MIFFHQLDNEDNTESFILPPGSKMLLHLSLMNTFSSPLTIQPTIKSLESEDINDKSIWWTFHPAFIYIPAMGKDILLCEIDILKSILPEKTYTFSIIFSGINDCRLKIKISISDKEDGCCGQIYDRSLDISLPLQTKKELHGIVEKNTYATSLYTISVLKILQGLDAIEKLPAKKFILEILLTICEIGARLENESENIILIQKVKRSIFFKNGVLIVAGSQILNWINFSNIREKSMFSFDASSKNRLLKQWEDLFTSIFLTHFECEEINKTQEPHNEFSTFQSLLQKIDNEPDRLFLFFMLGLMNISPDIKKRVLDLCSNIDYVNVQDGNLPVKVYNSVLKEKGSLKL